ncbi:box C/D snoRNA protein 1 [Acipenser ruthenus]|uniref:box C/D snoRNA protein 1 n=1 Tax=Acipenser ruthenus TaxID=7906 RepID=UPI0027408EBA|nr:box C/D snoRNA protein 1 [Acipenser ruthenus]
MMEGLILPKSESGLDSTVEIHRTMKRKMALSNCEACGCREAKYRCPGCTKHSCSLPCVKRHKSESGCSGVRDKAAFVPVGKFDEMNLLSDYRFLEDTGRLADGANRDALIHKPISNKFLRFLKSRARKFDLELKFLPIGFTKRKENTTFFNKRDNKFFWHLKLIFPQSHTEYVARRVPDDRTLDEILNLYIHPTESDPTIRQKLKVYVLSSCTQKIFMKVENRKSNSLRYYELDSKKSLLENLKNKTVIEYPVLHIVLEDHFHQYVGLGQAETKEGNEESSAGIPVKESEEQEEGEIQDDTDGVKAIGQQYVIQTLNPE